MISRREPGILWQKLGTNLAKARQLKQGMMQELLTGKMMKEA